MVTPSSQLDTANPIPGQLVFTDNNEIVNQLITANTTIILGQFVTFDSSGNVLLATNTSTQYDGIGVACYNPNGPISSQTATIVQPATLGTYYVQVAVGNTYVYTVADGTIKFMSVVGVDSSSYAIARVADTDSVTTPTAATVTAASKEWSFIAGRYFGHAHEEKTPTSAASADTIAVRLGL